MSVQAVYQPSSHANILAPGQVLRGGVLTRLGHLNQWVAWKYGPPRGDGKPSKIPIDPNSGKQASVTDSGTWAGFKAASEAVDRYGCAGVGFVFTDGDGFMFVDLDDCIVDGQVAPWALAIVEALDSYTEISPSGTGLKIWLEATKPGDLCRKDDVEMYEMDRYSTFTGERFAGGGIEERQDALNDLYRQTFPATPDTPSQAVSGDPRRSDGNLPDDYDLLDKARTTGADPQTFARLYDSGYRDGEDRSAADFKVMSTLTFFTGKDADRMERLFSASALGRRDKWKNRADYRRRTVANAIARTGKVYDPKHKPQETTREKLQRHMEYALFEHKWNTGRADAAATDLLAHMAMLRMAHKANKTSIRVSERELCEAAGIGGQQSASKALRRLVDLHRCWGKVANGGKDGAATYRLKTILPKTGQSLIRNNHLGKGVSTTNTVSIRSECPVLGSTFGLRNPAPEMPPFDKNGRKLPKSKPFPLKKLGKVRAWILLLVHAASKPLTISYLSERTGILPKHLKARHIPALVGLVEETEEGLVTIENVEDALVKELEDSGCNDAADNQRQRHAREREAYRMRKNEKTDTAPTEEEMDHMREQRENVEEDPFEDFEGIEMKPHRSVLVRALRDYLDNHPDDVEQTPYWLGATLWAFDLYPGHPSPDEVRDALVILEPRPTNNLKAVA